MNNLNIVIVGVGGQGTLMASRVLGALAQELGMNIKLSEVHGMAQRGGSVISFVRMGQEVHAPVIEPGGADYVLAFEALEAARALTYLKKGGTLIVNAQEIAPMPVIAGSVKYPKDLVGTMSGLADVLALNALDLARGAGEARAVNLVLLGALARLTGFDRDAWYRAIESAVPEKVRAVNRAAFDIGYQQNNR